MPHFAAIQSADSWPSAGTGTTIAAKYLFTAAAQKKAEFAFLGCKSRSWDVVALAKAAISSRVLTT